MNRPSPTSSLIAALIDDGTALANQLLCTLAAQLQTQGWLVRGVVRDDDPLSAHSGGGHAMRLLDVFRKEHFVISQDLGKESAACSVDESGIAQASVVLQSAIDEIQAAQQGTSPPPALVVVNRFGKLEEAGAGFTSELLALMVAEIPLIVLVGADCEARWQEFTAGMAQTLPLQTQALWDWCMRLPHSQASRFPQ